jgi:hypothetical protein
MPDEKAAPEEKYVWDDIEDPGPLPERPGPEPDFNEKVAHHVWFEAVWAFNEHLRKHRRWTVAQALKRLHDVEAKDPVVEDLRAAVLALGAAMLVERDRGLFGLGLGGLF